MLKIAFCDDDLSILNTLANLLNRYRTERDCELTYSSYRSSLELLSDMDRGLRWDILILDIFMPGENGMELAQEIRAVDQNVKIIFLTSSPDFALQSYSVEASYYQLKPICADNFFPIMDRVTDACSYLQSEKIVLKCKSGITAIIPSKLEYCEVIGRNLLFHMENGKVLESIGTLDELEHNLLFSGSFLRVRRSHLVNMAYIQSISYRAVNLHCLTEIPIPRGKYNDLKKAYLNYAFEKEQVLL